MNNTGGIFLVLLFAILIIVVWLVVAFAAACLAPSDRFWTFFCLTLVLGPLGILLAVIANPRDPAYFAPPPRPVAAGRQRFTCPRCGAHNDIPEHDTSYECWRCSEHRNVKPRDTPKGRHTPHATATALGEADPPRAPTQADVEEVDAAAAEAQARAKAARARVEELRRQAGETPRGGATRPP